MYAAVRAISYIAESVTSWEKESGSVAKLWASNIRFGYCAIFLASYLPEATILLRGLPYHELAPSKHLRCMPGDGRSATFNKVGNS